MKTKPEGEECHDDCHLSHSFTVGWLLSLCLQLPSDLPFTRYKSTRMALPLHPLWYLDPSLLSIPALFLLLRKNIVTKDIGDTCCAGLHLQPAEVTLESRYSCVLSLFWQLFSSPMKTQSSWYLTSHRKVYACTFKTKYVFQDTSKKHNPQSNAFPHLTELCRTTQKKPGRVKSQWTRDCDPVG